MAKEITITIHGAKELEKALAKGSKVAATEIAKALHTSATTLQARAKEYTPVKTGTLRRSISVEYGKTTAKVGTNLAYAPYLEFGTKAHGPKVAKFLVFTIGGEKIVTKRVKGIKPVKMFQRAVKDSTAAIAAAFDRAIAAVLHTLSS